MDIGVEISLYPLQQDYRPPVKALVERLHAQPELRVLTGSMSTQLVGDYERIMQTLARELRPVFAGGHEAVVVLKLVGPLGQG